MNPPQGSAKALLVDIGVNLTSNQFRKDTDALLARAAEAGVRDIIVTGTSEAASTEALALCQRLNGGGVSSGDANGTKKTGCRLFCTAGVHPHAASSYSQETSKALRSLASASEVVAIGETGLDFNRDFSPRDRQQQAFEAQLELAAGLQLPVFLHERDAHDRQLAILQNYRDHLAGAVQHCFTGDRRALFNYLDLDLYIGITGWVCDARRGLELQKLVPHIPKDRLLLETDAPYLLPRGMTPKPANKRNEPAFLLEIVDTVARLRNESAAELARVTTTNAYRLFRLPSSAVA